MEEEEVAYARVSLLAWVLPLMVLLTTLANFLMVHGYLKWFHPWKVIQQEVRHRKHS